MDDLNTIFTHWGAFCTRFGKHESFALALASLLPKITNLSIRSQVIK